MKAAIVGCGLIGTRRAQALGRHELVIAADRDLERARGVAAIGRAAVSTTDWQEAAAHPDVDLVIVSTTNDSLTPVALFAVEHGKHVLVEKPAARTPEEIAPLITMAAGRGSRVKVGFNLRFHPALRKAKELVDAGAVGDLMFIRGRYGHGGRDGYEKEWRADPAIAGGGELIDQGVHLIDLCRWMLGEFTVVDGFVCTYFWNMPVEDNAFVSLRTARGQAAWLHASCTEWKNMFGLEIYGRTGKLQVDGLGGSYGVERLSYFKLRQQMGPPETTIWEYPFADRSWQAELEDFVEAIARDREPEGNLHDARAALEIVQQVYSCKR
ncbi:MAG: Gfo/Idh/MocA family oxidoreductase [Acidobacteria bacterium]|nr:Gfo/Idh/MocA family oxidoreductase [Acidobacteriota bacterium]